MTTLSQSPNTQRKPSRLFVISGLGLLSLAAAIALPNLSRSRTAANRASASYRQRTLDTELARGAYAPTLVKTRSAEVESSGVEKILRTSSMAVIVQHPAEATQRITALADALGGYLVSSESGSENVAVLTIRVPAGCFEQARAEIRKLGLRVESEKVEAQDVTMRYVDQDATIRNLRAEEAGYLSILKQATTVKDMLAVSQTLSEVRRQIEQQQAEFNVLSKQVETGAISISLRTEFEAQVFGLNWHPLNQVKMALSDGLESIGNYAAAMTAIIFYLPATLLWVGTLFFSALGSWRLVVWVGRRWFRWKPEAVVN